MVVRIDITGDLESLSRTMSRIERLVLPKAAVSAINKTGTKASTKAKRATNKTLGVTAKLAKKAYKVYKASLSDPSFALVGTGKPIPLIAFKAKQLKRKGVVAAPFGKRRKFGGAFIASVKSGPAVFRRRGVERGPLRELYGPALPVGMRSADVDKVWGDEIKLSFGRTFSQRIDFYASKLAK